MPPAKKVRHDHRNAGSAPVKHWLYSTVLGVLALVLSPLALVAITPQQDVLLMAGSNTTIPGKFGPGLANSKTLVAYGDSFESNAGTGGRAESGNYIGFAQMYSDYRLNFTANCGVFGYTTAQILANIGCVLSAAPDVVIMSGGTNDVAGSTACATVVANKRQIYAALKAAHIFVISVSIIPRSSPLTFTTAQNNIAQCVNEQDRRYAQEQGSNYFSFIDLDPIVVDATQPTTWAIKSGYLIDGVHPAEIGASPMGYAIAQSINQVFQNWRQPTMVNGDVYDATNNPYGNLLNNGLMQGTSGGLGSCTGTMAGADSAHNTLVSTGTPGTCVSSVVTWPDGRQAAQIVLSGSASGATSYLGIRNIDGSPGNIAIGDTIEAQAEICLLGNTTNMSGFDLALVTTEGGTGFQVNGFAPNSADPFPSAGFLDGRCHTFITTPRTIGATLTSIYTEVRLWTLAASVTPAATVQITSVTIKKVVQ
jgi:lysophospholipase L1-like esterase